MIFILLEHQEVRKKYMLARRKLINELFYTLASDYPVPWKYLSLEITNLNKKTKNVKSIVSQVTIMNFSRYSSRNTWATWTKKTLYPRQNNERNFQCL